MREVIGTYGLAVICADQPDTIVGARRGSPLIIGIGKGENFLASDANAIVAHTKKVVYLNDYDVATITPERFDVLNLGTDTANVQISNLEFSQEDAVRGKHAHFMLKEIFEQPQHGGKRPARPRGFRRRHREVRRLEHDARRNCAPSTASSSPPAARAGTRRWWANI